MKTPAIKNLHAAAAALLLLGQLSTAQASPTERFKGIWLAPQQGYVLDLTERKPRVFHITPGACWVDKQMAESVAPMLAYARVASDGLSAVASAAPGASEASLTRLQALPERCTTQTDTSPPAVMAALIETMSEHFAFFAERGMNWPGMAAQATQAINANSTEAQLFAEMSKLLTATNDAHVKLQATIDGDERRLITGRGDTLTALRTAFAAQTKVRVPAAFLANWSTTIRDNVNNQILEGKGRFALNGHGFWGITAPALGGTQRSCYLPLAYLTDFTNRGGVAEDVAAVNEQLDEIFSACAQASNFILDISQNRGGDDRVALAVASRFAQAPMPVFQKQAHAKSGKAPIQAFSIAPTSRPTWRKPVTVLVDSMTVSAGEILAVSMRALPQANLVGQPTRGAVSDALEKSLPNGWRFTLSNEIYTSPSGELLEVKGVKPKQAVKWFDPSDMQNSHARQLSALLNQ